MPSTTAQPDPTQLLADLRGAITSNDTQKARETLATATQLDASLPITWEVESTGLLDLTPCEMAARGGNVAMLEILFELVQLQPAQPTSNAQLSISFWQRIIAGTIMSGQTAPLKFVVRKLDANQREAILGSHTALFEAIRQDKPEAMLLLAAHGANLEHSRNPRGQCALHVAIENDAEKCFDQVLATVSSLKDVADRHGQTPLHYAAEFGRVEMTQLLLMAGADANARSTVRHLTPLHLAVRNAHVEVVRVLLAGNAYGGTSADPNAVGIGGKTPLHDVFSIDANRLDDAGGGCRNGSITDDDSVLSDDEEEEAEDPAETVQCDLLYTLLTNGADPNLLDASPGFSALHLAIRGECEHAIDLLLDHDADPNVRTTIGGLSSLHVAASFDASVDMWRKLLDRGADLSLEDDEGHRAVELIIDHDKAREVAELL